MKPLAIFLLHFFVPALLVKLFQVLNLSKDIFMEFFSESWLFVWWRCSWIVSGKEKCLPSSYLEKCPLLAHFLWIFPGKQHASMGLPPKVSLNIIAFECMQYSYTNVTVCIFKKRKWTNFCILQGSNTLPRAGQRNKLKQPGLGSVDDSEIVITKKLTGGGSSVRIRIGGSARSPTEQVRWRRCWWCRWWWRSWWWRWQRWWWC